MEKQLDENLESLLRYIQSEEPSVEAILSEYQDIYNKSTVKQLIRALEDLRYIKTEERLVFAASFGMNNDVERTRQAYVLSPLGKNCLAKSTANFTSFSNISNSNIAHQSPGAKQSIEASKQPQDIQEKIKELELAVLKKDSSAIKKTFEYIADKSVDVAIAIITGSLLR